MWVLVTAIGRKQVLSLLLRTLFFLNTIYLSDAYHLISKVNGEIYVEGSRFKKIS